MKVWKSDDGRIFANKREAVAYLEEKIEEGRRSAVGDGHGKVHEEGDDQVYAEVVVRTERLWKNITVRKADAPGWSHTEK